MNTSNLVLYYSTTKGVVTPYPSKPSPKPKSSSKPKKPQKSKPTSIPHLDILHSGYIDAHTHIDSILKKMKVPLENFSDFAKENFKNGWQASIQVAASQESFLPTKFLVENNPQLYSTYGVHPHDAKTYNDDVEKQIVELMDHPKTKAWGEIGLDYFYNLSDQDTQKRVFKRQLEKAVECKKPIVIHTREAESDTLAFLREIVPKDWRIHIHCFTSSLSLAETLLAEWPNLCIGFTGVVTFKNSEAIREVVGAVPIERMLLETDGPFMAPMPFRGQTCHSGHIPYTAMTIASVK
eukprot:CAMPEP_0174266930 /NCGR_PEP_ID=MMETSP0439-20130205/31913_1 /TAXON_ID=0 /ORGANISM="Stereomyxa ramosa, Strain Chinc5" /LENGTH=293 /DNA_ID=CAMNT_0015354185 /DNA_START=57 /DNA_END=935 /DNA_ORIENTATION=+